MSDASTVRVPLTATQVEAAGRVHAHLPRWKLTDDALDDLAKRMPGFDEHACLIKASAINQLYGTNVYALVNLATHVSEVMETPDRVDLVETLARVVVQDKERRHLSFASKFAHFFVDKDAYPIFDSYAVHGLRVHLSGTNLSTDTTPRYADFVAALNALTRLSGLSCSGRELDRYLWLSGLYRTWLRNPNAQINVEARDLFIKAKGEVAVDLQLLLG